jgi:hypothetical protein
MTLPPDGTRPLRSRLTLLALCGLAACDGPTPQEPTAPAVFAATASPTAAATATVFASGLRFPRGFTWGPDGSLYVAEAGSGGTHSTRPRECAQVDPPIGPYTNGTTARISRIRPDGRRTTFALGFPSAMNAMGDVMGVADVAFLHGHLYALVAGGGCSHGSRGTPAGVAKVASDGSWHIVANLSAYQANHPVAHPSSDDFEPDGSWYSMVAGSDYLFAVEPNHGELVRILPGTGKVSRIADVSASQGHVVPTVLALHEGAFYVSNLGTFPITTGAERLFRIDREGGIRIVRGNLTTVLGLDFDARGRAYLLEMTKGGGFPVPGTGRVVRINFDGTRDVIVKGLFLPTAMRFGPDGRLYISNKGFGPPQPGEILRVDVPGMTPAAVATH